MSTTDKKKWGKAVLSISWQADRHCEQHSIEFQRPTAGNPSPEYPVVAGKLLSRSRLPMSDRWGELYAPIMVETFDEHSMTISYGSQQYILKPADGPFSFGEKGMDYTSFSLVLSLKAEDEDPVFTVSHSPLFLRRFHTRERVMQLTDDDVQLLRKEAAKGDCFAQYGLGRWLYYNLPEDTSMREAEELFVASKEYIPDALAAYALMLHYGETKENTMDLKESNKLLQTALMRGSERAALQLARYRIFGSFCEAEPETVAQEIEQRIGCASPASQPNDYDPYWHILLAFAYEQLDRKEEAVSQYDEAIAKGEWEAYYFMAFLYKERGNMALYDSLMEEGIRKGSGYCCIHGADMEEEDYEKIASNYHKRIKHEIIENRLNIGVKRGDGTCAYYLWLHTYDGSLGFNGNEKKWSAYLKQGVKMGDVNCIIQMAQLAEDGEWPEALSACDMGELWLRAARYYPDNEDALRGLSRVSDPAFLLKHKVELEHYWQPLIKQLEEKPDDDGRFDAWV